MRWTLGHVAPPESVRSSTAKAAICYRNCLQRRRKTSESSRPRHDHRMSRMEIWRVTCRVTRSSGQRSVFGPQAPKAILSDTLERDPSFFLTR